MVVELCRVCDEPIDKVGRKTCCTFCANCCSCGCSCGSYASKSAYVGCGGRSYWICDGCEKVTGRADTEMAPKKETATDPDRDVPAWIRDLVEKLAATIEYQHNREIKKIEQLSK